MYAVLSPVETTATVVLNMADEFMISITSTRNIQAILLISKLVSVLISALQSELFVWI